ncbi:MAG: hypothetical protein DMF69_03395 [Acidobacteria bacterium]|nr:MAG: hypothetical protein DMF69_03395 [Acidobacteriota bacterium]
MQDALQIEVASAGPSAMTRPESRALVFGAVLVVCIFASATFASWLPLQISIVTVFLFAGPHNWFELRYFLMRLPVRFGKSRNFFLTAFTGLGILTISYVALPVVYRATSWTNEGWSIVIASWNTLLLVWLCVLILLRGEQKPRSNWTWAVPVTLAACGLNWLAPDFFSLALVYIHPLIAFWFLDRHLRRTRPSWVATYRRCLAIVPVVVLLMIWQLTQTSSLAETNGLFWRITQHSGAELLPNVSSHLLVSIHLFLEMLHYGVWIIALPLIGSTVKRKSKPIWDPKSIPIARHPRGFPKSMALLLCLGLVVVVVLWAGFSVDYATTRDIYFTLAIAHVMAEAPFLLRMI